MIPCSGATVKHDKNKLHLEGALGYGPMIPPNTSLRRNYGLFENNYGLFEDNCGLFVCVCRIVGDDDHGVTFTPEQYEEYKRRVIPIVRVQEEGHTYSKSTRGGSYL